MALIKTGLYSLLALGTVILISTLSLKYFLLKMEHFFLCARKDISKKNLGHNCSDTKMKGKQYTFLLVLESNKMC